MAADAYYDVELSHSRHDDGAHGAPCDCEEHGGRDCEMESAAVAQVVTWQQKFGGQIPKKTWPRQDVSPGLARLVLIT
jgi:hypothetical protein